MEQNHPLIINYQIIRAWQTQKLYKLSLHGSPLALARATHNKLLNVRKKSFWTRRWNDFASQGSQKGSYFCIDGARPLLYYQLSNYTSMTNSKVLQTQKFYKLSLYALLKLSPELHTMCSWTAGKKSFWTWLWNVCHKNLQSLSQLICSNKMRSNGRSFGRMSNIWTISHSFGRTWAQSYKTFLSVIYECS